LDWASPFSFGREEATAKYSEKPQGGNGTSLGYGIRYLVDDIVLLSLHQLFSAVVVMASVLRLFLTFSVCVLMVLLISDGGMIRDGILFVSSFTNQFRLFLVLPADVHFIWLCRFSGVSRQLGRRVKHLCRSSVRNLCRARLGELVLDQSFRVFDLLLDSLFFLRPQVPWPVVLSAGLAFSLSLIIQ
jgi:hypothetical protein